MNANRLIHAVELVKSRRARLQKRGITGSHRVLRLSAILLAVLSMVAAVLALAALPFYFYLTAGLPPVARLGELLDPTVGELLQPTQLYDRTGESLILTLAPEGIERQFVSAADVPFLADAFIASSQPDFRQRANSNWALIADPAKTIAEKLVTRVLLPSQPDGWVKNVRTNLLAAEILEKYGADQVLTWTLNSLDFGHWAFGVESASQLYFGRSASDLSLAESALLAAVAQAPALNPHDTPELAIRFQTLVLTAMYEQGFITEAELNSALDEQLIFASGQEPVSQAPEFTELAVEQLEAELGYTRVINGGLEVTTTLDYALQQEVTDSSGANELAMVILDPVNNRILASSGDVKSLHASGHLLNPFAYLIAFAQGLAPASLAWDIDQQILTTDTQKATSIVSFHGPVTMRQSLANNYSNVTMALFKDPGTNRNFSELLQVLEVETRSGSTELSVLQASQIYTILAQNGLKTKSISSSPNTLLFAADLSGTIELDLTQTEWLSIVSPEIAYLVTDILSDTTFWPTSLEITRPAASITDLEGGWQLMFSPQRVAVIWNAEEINPILMPSVFEIAHHNLPPKDWEAPAGLTSVIVCVPSGQLPDDDCPETRREWFLRGNEPTDFDNLYRRIAINTLNGKLATVFTPAEFVQERVFMIVPSEAETWAQAAGIQLPPNDYDPVPAKTNDELSQTITEPQPFTKVNGLVEIFGTLPAEIVGYDIQAGQGLRPSEWTLLAESETTPRTRELAQWNTEGLKGIWAIQLQGWDVNGRITRAYTIVTIE